MTREEHIATLQETYGRIQTMDPSEDTYIELIEFLDNLDTEMLMMLAGAKIKWVSMLANNRVIRRKLAFN